MLINFGAKQRTRDEFEAMLKQADPRFNITRVSHDRSLGLLEVYLKRAEIRKISEGLWLKADIGNRWNGIKL